MLFYSYCDAARQKKKKPKPEPKKEEVKKPVRAEIPIPAKVEKEISNLSKEQMSVLAGIADQILAIQKSKEAFENAVAELKVLEAEQQAEVEKSSVMRDGKKQIEQMLREDIEAKYCERIAKLKVVIVAERKKFLEAQKNFKLVE